jgi:hypothetical protein
MRTAGIAIAYVVAISTVSILNAQSSQLLKGVKQIAVEDTIVGNKEKVKEDFAPALVADSLRNALKGSNFEVVESGAAVRSHVVLDEFSSGRLVFQDQTGKELANIPIRVRGNLAWSSYQGGNTQRRQATNSFEQRLSEEIARLK